MGAADLILKFAFCLLIAGIVAVNIWWQKLPEFRKRRRQQLQEQDKIPGDW